LDELSVIHVSGTKGKGSTCAFCESILRHHGYKTGFFSSPHLVAVRERIRINGQPLSELDFAKYFWKVYNPLLELRVWDTGDTPVLDQLQYGFGI
jgi:folylpolyglutamate synthase